MTEQERLQTLFTEYDKNYPDENNIGKVYRDLLERKGEEAFYRNCMGDGHFTGSMYVFNKEKTKILLMHHKKLNKWLQFGGHADGDMDIKNVALRELEEESGILCQKEDIFDGVVDLDRHMIPANTTKGEPEHYHYDVRFVVLVDEDVEFVKQEEEVNDIAWFNFDEAKKLEETGETDKLLKIIDKLV